MPASTWTCVNRSPQSSPTGQPSPTFTPPPPIIWRQPPWPGSPTSFLTPTEWQCCAPLCAFWAAAGDSAWANLAIFFVLFESLLLVVAPAPSLSSLLVLLESLLVLVLQVMLSCVQGHGAEDLQAERPALRQPACPGKQSGNEGLDPVES